MSKIVQLALKCHCQPQKIRQNSSKFAKICNNSVYNIPKKICLKNKKFFKFFVKILDIVFKTRYKLLQVKVYGGR